MTFQNIDTGTVIVFFFLVLVGTYLLFRLYVRNKKDLNSCIILFFSYLFLIVSILGPSGTIQDEEVETMGANIVFVLDVSKSMRALDFKEGRKLYSRLDASKNLISYILAKNINNKYGLNIFSGESLEVVPLTLDHNFFATILQGVDEKNLSKYGTDLVSTIDTSIKFFTGEDEKGLIVIVTDGGEDTYEHNRIKDIKKTLNENDLDILFIGVGSEKGNYIPIGRDVFGELSFKNYNGQRVVTKLEYDKLKNISSDLGAELVIFDDFSDRDKIEEAIISNSKNIKFFDTAGYARNFESYFVLVSFILFIFFIINNHLLGRRK